MFYRNTGVEGEWNFYQKDTWLYPIFRCHGSMFCSYICRERIFSFIFTIPLAIVFIWSWFSTKYIVGEETITIRSGFVNKRIFIRDIKQISNTKNPIAAYALSFDRLEIIYGSHQTEIISPKDKEQFINLVTSKIHTLKQSKRVAS